MTKKIVALIFSIFVVGASIGFNFYQFFAMKEKDTQIEKIESEKVELEKENSEQNDLILQLEKRLDALEKESKKDKDKDKDEYTQSPEYKEDKNKDVPSPEYKGE